MLNKEHVAAFYSAVNGLNRRMFDALLIDQQWRAALAWSLLHGLHEWFLSAQRA